MRSSYYDWESARADYIAGGVTLAELSEKYGIPKGSIGVRCTNEGWRYMRSALDPAEKIADAVCGANGELDGAKLQSVIFDGICSREKLFELRDIAEALTEKVKRAVFDELQFNRYLVSEKGSDENGKSTSFTVEKCFDKLDTKSLKETVGALKVLTECIRTLYGIPTFGETARLYLADRDEDEEGDGEITVEFVGGEEFAE